MSFSSLLSPSFALSMLYSFISVSHISPSPPTFSVAVVHLSHLRTHIWFLGTRQTKRWDGKHTDMVSQIRGRILQQQMIHSTPGAFQSQWSIRIQKQDLKNEVGNLSEPSNNCIKELKKTNVLHVKEEKVSLYTYISILSSLFLP